MFPVAAQPKKIILVVIRHQTVQYGEAECYTTSHLESYKSHIAQSLMSADEFVLTLIQIIFLLIRF